MQYHQSGTFFSTGPLGYICTKINFPSYLAPFFCSKHKTTGRNQMLHGMLLNARLDSGLQSQNLVSFLLSSHLPNQVTADYDKKSQILQVRWRCSTAHVTALSTAWQWVQCTLGIQSLNFSGNQPRDWSKILWAFGLNTNCWQHQHPTSLRSVQQRSKQVLWKERITPALL